jgi:WD40 repeat protein/tetratricopeptide (TPR) repeat protein
MAEWKFTEASNGTENQQALARLVRAIALSKEQFSLILVRCNYSHLRKEMLTKLREYTGGLYLREIYLEASNAANLHVIIRSQLALDSPASPPAGVMVFGLETVVALDNLLTGINQARDVYASTFSFPVVLWLNDEVATQLSRLAPDFKSWAATTIKFEMAQADLIALVCQGTESLFSQILEVGASKLLSGSGNNLDFASQEKKEIESARNDLSRIHKIQLQNELAASLDFVCGRDCYLSDKIDSAFIYFQNSLQLWEKSQQGERQAIVMLYMGLCYRRKADLHLNQSRNYWQEALLWFKKCLNVLEFQKREDLAAKFILPINETLYRLEAWTELEQTAKKALLLHQSYRMEALVARDYGFLAAVAASDLNWLQAYDLVNIALSISEKTTGVSRLQESWYLLLQSRCQRHLGNWEEAINNLEWARVVCELQYDPALYVSILEELRSLYFFEQRDYMEAYRLKQEQIQIEHQYGFRAFIGASQLQPQRYKINLALEQNKSLSLIEEVAQEISVSGRQQDVNRLLERITRADCKLTIIHGPSGVGKSSIVKAGLVPALKGKSIGERIPCSIVLSVYTDWVTALGRNLNQFLAQAELSLALEITPEIIIEKLRLLTEHNYTVVLIFDQFEEFFFVSKTSDKVDFYRFFSESLNLPFLKIMLSLREDYLHYLLELERLSKSEIHGSYDLGVINKNILDKDIRYYLGNFTPQDARSVVQSLTQRSHYQLSEELINQLVEDLAGDLNAVHPIELQIVGAQMQCEKMTTIEQYQESGGSEKLVERWLEEVIKDCGRENEELSWKLLFELTDEKGTRPLKTKADIALAVCSDFDSPWNWQLVGELILDILVDSGLVLRMREESGDRYQLVHDYLVKPIRQKNSYGIVAELEKTRYEKNQAEVAQRLSQEQLNIVLHRRLREARIAGVALATMAATIATLWWQADLQKRDALRQSLRAERSESNFKISAITASSEALLASNKEFDSLLESLRAWRKMKATNDVQSDTKMRVVTALQQAVYNITEGNRLEGHNDIVWGISFSPDGQLLASASKDKSINIWRPDGKLLQTLKGHNDSVSSVSFSPDGQSLVSSSYDKTIKIWRRNPNTGLFDSTPFKTLEGHIDLIASVAFSPDGQLLASAAKDKTIILWNSDGSLVTNLRGHKGWVNWVTFSPNGKFIVSAGEDKTIKIWRRDGSFVTSLNAHEKGVTFIAFSHDGKMLASAGRDKVVKIWQLESKNDSNAINLRLYKKLEGHTSAIWCVGFSHDGETLASASDDNTINLWNFKNSTLIKSFKGHSDAVVSLSFSPDNQVLATSSYDKTIRLWSLHAPKLPKLNGHEDRVESVAWSPDGQMLASASKDKNIRLWLRSRSNKGLETQLYKTLEGHKDKVTSVNFNPNGQILASSSYDNTIKLWRRNGELIKTLEGHTDGVVSVNFSSDGQLFASASKDKTVKIWTVDGFLVKTLNGHQDRVNSVSFSPDGQLIASASDDKTVKLWHRDGTLIKTFPPHDSWVLSITFSPTDELIASASQDNTVRLWTRDGKLLKTLLKGYSDSVNAVNFSPNGEILAAASWDSTVKLWSREGKLIKTLNGHNSPALSASFSPDGQTLASGSGDSTSSNADNSIILWNLELDDLLVRGCSWVDNYLKYNSKIDGRDRALCEGIAIRN